MSEYIIREVVEEEFRALYDAHKKQVFVDTHSFVLWDMLSQSELEQLEKLRFDPNSRYSIRLGVFKDKEFVGWAWGFQEDSTSFYMCNSAILPKHRRKGLYTKLIEKTLEMATNKGFQTITSRHTMTNNAVLIPKLKAGFIINKMELDDMFGALVQLSFYTNKTRRKIMDYRAGQLRPDDEIKKVFKIN